MTPRDTLLIVDDAELNRAILRSLFEKDFNILEAVNGEQALLLMRQCRHALAAVLMDLAMPVKDGYQVMAQMRKEGMLGQVPIIIISEGSLDNEVRAFDLGASDIIVKPFEPHVVLRRVDNIVELNRHKLHLEELVEEQSTKLRDSNDIMIDALSSVIEYRNLESGQHILRIRMFTKVLLEDVGRCYPEYDLDERKIALITSASAMHDIGKIAIPDNILLKPGRLTREEFEIMKTHTVKGCQILAGFQRMESREYHQYVINICRYHHERWDGQGYPDRLKGDSIPICAQVVGIADAYDALTTDRVYKEAYTPQRAFNMILNGECGAFSPKLLESFKNVRGRFAQLSKGYADGLSPKSDVIAPKQASLVRRDDDLSTLQLAQMKYFALLRCLNATVVEADIKNSLFHLVYLGSADLRQLGAGESFDQMLGAFVSQLVHPQDQALLNDLTAKGMEDFFQQGLMQRCWRCRVFSAALSDYQPYQVSLLRIDLDDPHSRKVIMVWQAQPRGAVKASPAKHLDYKLFDQLGGVQKTLNDRYRTMLRVSASFLQLTGYTQSELHTQFDDRYTLLVHPDDRALLAQETGAQLSHGVLGELEYRLLAKDGTVKWVLDKGQAVQGADGQEYLYFLLVDITQSKKAQEQLRLTLERHQIILDQTNDIIFEWDMVKDTISFTPNWEEKFGYAPQTNVQNIPRFTHMHPEDIAPFAKLMEQIRLGLNYVQSEVRLANKDGRYLWCRIRTTAQLGAGGQPIKAVGVIVDIDRERRATQLLEERAKQDALTKLYDRTAAQQLVDDYLSQRRPEEQAAMLLVDIDNFRQVNERRGHLFGDTVIAQVAGQLSALFRAGDVVARIGGDEFLVFMRDIPGESAVSSRAERIIGTFGQLLQDEPSGIRLSCSIGLALCPHQGSSYQQLFQCADRALFQARALGSSHYVFYRDALDDQFWAPAASAASPRIDSGEAIPLAPQAFLALYQAQDVETAISDALELGARQMAADRAYIYECGQGRRTFAWRAGDADGLDFAKAQDAGDWERLFLAKADQNGVYYCPDVNRLPQAARDILLRQGVRSMLRCAIRDEGNYMGFIAFDAYHGQWTQNQVKALGALAQVIAVFLAKHRARQALDQQKPKKRAAARH